MPLAHLVDPFKQVNLIVNDEGDTNSHTTGSIGEMQVEEADNDDSDMREIKLRIGKGKLTKFYSNFDRYKM